MQARDLGNGGPKVSAIGSGCMGMSWSCGAPRNQAAMTSLLHAAVEQSARAHPTSRRRIAQAAQENPGAADVELASGDLNAIEEASSTIEVKGARHAAFHE